MASNHVLILSSGGLRSLVATALVLQPGEKTKVTLLHVADGRDNAPARFEHVRKHAEAYNIARVGQLELPHLYTQVAAPAGDTRARVAVGTLVEPQLLLAALAYAKQQGAQRVVWPCSCNAELKPMSRATEQSVLCGHLAELAGPGGATPVIDTPLLEYTDRQIVELGAQLDVSWRLAWSCQGKGDTPCRNCPACRRRAAAFDAAGVLDPQAMPAAAHARR